ncbi:tubulin epsilon and delta complex protein 1-like [Styela clava]
MSKEKGQSTTDVRESITIICRMLKYSDIYHNLSPDSIRQAKFDKPEVVNTLVEVLFAIIEYDDKSNQSSVGENLQTKIIVNKLKHLWYPRLSILIDEKGKFHSSREILLAISWYFHCARTFDFIRNKASEPVDILNILSTLTKKSKFPKTCDRKSTSNMDQLSIEDKMNYISWLVSQIRSFSNQIISIESGNQCKKFQITSHTISSFQQDPLLILVLRYPALQTEFERRLERKVLLLQSCIKWKSLQNVFWVWMDSVLSNAPCQESKSNSTFDVQSTCQSPLLPVFKDKMKCLQTEVEKNVKNTSEKLDLLSSLQPEQRAEIDKEINLLNTLIRDAGRHPKLRRVKGNSVSSVDHHGHGVEKIIPLSESDRLENCINKMEEAIDNLRLTCKEKILQINGNFPEVVLISPEVPSHKKAVSEFRSCSS